MSGKSKCHKMHVGRKHGACPILKVHGTIMQEVTEETYLGDIISCDGKNTKNLKNRISKGVGIITKILNLLEVISFGPFLFEIALLLREAMLVNGTLTNAEVWYNLSSSEINELEALDKMFFRRVLGVPGSTPSEAYHLEFGVLPFGVIIKAKRINYLHKILSGNKTGMLFSFFITQWHNPTQGDWTEQVKVDLKDFGISENFDFITSKSKQAFKRLVKTKANEYALNKLLGKQAANSKIERLKYSELKIQNYLVDENLNPNEMKTVFRYRTRMEEFSENFRGGNDLVVCPLCSLHLDSQDLCFQCPVMKKDLGLDGDMAEVYKTDISKEIIQKISKISEYRKEKIVK